MSTTNVSELGYLFFTKSSLHIIARDLDVRDHSCWMMIKLDSSLQVMAILCCVAKKAASVAHIPFYLCKGLVAICHSFLLFIFSIYDTLQNMVQ